MSPTASLQVSIPDPVADLCDIATILRMRSTAEMIDVIVVGCLEGGGVDYRLKKHHYQISNVSTTNRNVGVAASQMRILRNIKNRKKI